MDSPYAAMKGKRIFVTGATGFIGMNLVKSLLSFHADVHALVYDESRGQLLRRLFPSIHTHPGDIRDGVLMQKVLCEADPDIIFHGVVARSRRPENERNLMFEINVRGAENLIQACGRIRPERLVVLASSLEYGHRDVPLEEKMAPLPHTLHGATKAAATLLFQQAVHGIGLPVVILRIFSVYGPWEPLHRLIPTAIMAGLLGGELKLTAPGIRHDYVHVDDVVEACLRAALTDNVIGEIINIGTGVQTTNEEVTRHINELTGGRIRVVPNAFPAREADTSYWVADTRKCEDLFAWKPQIILRRGLENTIGWFRTNQLRGALGVF